MVLQINGLTLALGEGEDRLPARVASLLGLPAEAVNGLRVLRRSIDARRSRPPRFVYLLAVTLADGAAFSSDSWRPEAGISVTAVTEVQEPVEAPAGGTAGAGRRAVVVGCGPAGLFAALTLARGGISVLLLERGRAIPERIRDVRAFWERGVLNPESHVHFGEGGAGTFSDGKLTTRVKNPRTAWVKQVLAQMGAPEEILYEARPHIGTDRLREVVMNLRGKLMAMGCEIRFGACVTDVLIRQGKLVGVVVNKAEEIGADCLILAIGQSADDTYRLLAERGVALAAKPFALGVRVEHPQELINAIQYGKWAGHPDLPPADYFLTAQLDAIARSVYSFCMCPGGLVIGCSDRAGGMITNGMSRFRRDSPWANSAVVVNVRPEDLGQGALAGLDFRRRWEERAFAAGGGDYYAPVQRLTDFLSRRPGPSPGACSFLPGVRSADLEDFLPPFAAEALRQGFAVFEGKMPGFVTSEALLIGVETRTSSPVRILRGEDGQAVNTRGLFPCGEGAGYAGGIVSSALDGIRAAERALCLC
jgi:uncharacterized FAD-dependent dehydrogenase